MPNQSQQRVYVNFTSDEFDNIADDLFQVVGFDGVEAISELFEFNIDLISNDPNIDLKSLVGKNATLAITKDGELRNFHGIISVFKQGEEAQFDHYCYKAVLVPRLWCMSLSRQNQIHQEKRVPDIVKDEILHGDFCGGILADDIDNRMAEDYPVREYTVQYRESDLDFISRLMEHEGIYYYFDHVDGHDKLVFCDEKSKLDEVLVENTVSYVPKSGLASFDDQAIHSFNSTQTQICKEIILKDYNYRTPHLPMEGNAETGDLGYGRKYAYGDHFKDVIQGNKLAQRRAQMERCQEHTCTGTSDALFFQAGKLIQVEDHYRGSLNGEYLITRIRHMGGQALPGMSGAGLTGQAVDYQNEFEGLPCDIEFRPALRHKTPKLYGFMSAIVDGVADTDRAQIDEHGRYKLLMPFDVSGTAEGKASRWVRKAEMFGGQGTGMNFPLLKGTEVMWSCMDGDLDRPIITGVVPGTGDGLNKSMVTSANSTVNKIKTPGNIVIEMQDGQGSGSADDTGTEQHNSRYYGAPTVNGVKPLLTEQQNNTVPSPASATSDTRADTGGQTVITEGSDDKWMNIAVNEYAVKDAKKQDSFIRLGTESDHPKDKDYGPGMVLYTDGDYVQKHDKNCYTTTAGFTYSYGLGMSYFATLGYKAFANVSGTSTATIGYDFSFFAGAKTAYTGGSTVSLTEGYEYNENNAGQFTKVKGPKKMQAESILLKASKDISVGHKYYRRLAIATSALAGAANVAMAPLSLSIDAGNGDDKMGGGGSMGGIIASAAASVAAIAATHIYAYKKRKDADTAAEESLICLDDDSITLSCNGSSIVICGQGVFINGVSLVVGGVPDGLSAEIKLAEEAAVTAKKDYEDFVAFPHNLIDGIARTNKERISNQKKLKKESTQASLDGLKKQLTDPAKENETEFAPNNVDFEGVVVEKKTPELIQFNTEKKLDIRAKEEAAITVSSDVELKYENDLPETPNTQLKMTKADTGAVELTSKGGIKLDAKDKPFEVKAETVDIVATSKAQYLGKPAFLGKSTGDVSGAAGYKATGA
jgi:type VI secretion system VgrG family protein